MPYAYDSDGEFEVQRQPMRPKAARENRSRPQGGVRAASAITEPLPPRERKYQRPYSEEGQWLSVDVPLNVAPDLKRETARTADAVCIAATTQRSTEDTVTVELSCIKSQPDWSGQDWVHVQDANTSLSTLTRLIYTLPGVSNEEIVLAERMLRDIEAKAPSGLADCNFVSPGTVLRYDARDEFSNSTIGDMSVIFLAIPYFVVKDTSALLCSSNATTQALLASLYPYERNLGRDRRQIFSLYSTEAKSEIICVSQTLVLVFGSVLVTLSEQSRHVIGGSILKDIILDSTKNRPSFARVTNPVGDVVSLRIDPLPSFFSLLEQIELRCLDGTAIDFDNFTLCFKDGVELDPVSWLSRTENNSSAIIEIFFHRNQQYMFEPLLYPSNVRSRTEPPKPFPSYQTEFTHDEERMGRDSDYGDRIIIRTSPRNKRRDSTSIVRRRRVRWKDSESEDETNRSVQLSRPLVLGGNTGVGARHRGLGPALTKYQPPQTSASLSQYAIGSHSADDHVRPLVQGLNYHIGRNKPEIYRFQDASLTEVNGKKQTLICAAQTSPGPHHVISEKEVAGSNMEPQFQWGFIWNGKSQSELRNVSVPIYAAITYPENPPTHRYRPRARRTPNRRKVGWREKQHEAHESKSMVRLSKLPERPQQQRRPLLALPQPRVNSANPRESGALASQQADGWGLSSSEKLRSSSLDRAEALALVPFKGAHLANDKSNLLLSEPFESHDDDDYKHRTEREIIINRVRERSTSQEYNYVLPDRHTAPNPGAQSNGSWSDRSWSSGRYSDDSDQYYRTDRQPRTVSDDVGEIYESLDSLYHEERRFRAGNYRLIDEEAQMNREREQRRRFRTLRGGSESYTRSSRRKTSSSSSQGSSPRYLSPIRSLEPLDSSGWLASYTAPQGPTMGPQQQHRTTQKAHNMSKCHPEDRRKLYNRKVPPFFAWHEKIQSVASDMKPDITMLESILRDTHDRLATATDSQSRKAYRRSHEMELAILEKSSSQIEVEHLLCDSETPSLFRDLRYNIQYSEQADSSEMDMLVSSILGWSYRTIELFLPKMTAAKPVHKIWGSLNYSTSMLKDTRIEISTAAKEGCEQTKWMVKDFEHWENIAEKLLLPMPAAPRSCRCYNEMFESRQDAIDHLSGNHFRRKSLPASRNVLIGKFVISAQAKLSAQRLLALLKPLEYWHKFLHGFHAQMEELALGVATADKKIQRQLRLTVSLVDSFASYVLAHTKVDHLVGLVDRHFRERLQGLDVDLTEHERNLEGDSADLRRCCEAAMENARTAYHQVIVLSTVETRVGAIELSSVSLPSIVAGLLAAAQSTIFTDRQDAVTHYEACVAKLQYQVNQLPRKKLLHHIHQLEEELRAVRQTIETSKILLRNYARTLRPDSFRITTRLRQSLFVIEEPFLKRTYRLANEQLRALEVLEQRSQGLVAQVKRSVEILEEDHGKAILIFTIITTIFLPLSFMTGFFGMNVSDIRNMSGKQWTFWAAAIPFTTIIACIVLLMAFKGSDLLETIGPSGSLRLKVHRMTSRVGNFMRVSPRRKANRTDTDLTFASA